MKLKDLKIGKSIEIFVLRDKYRLKLISKIEKRAIDHICITLIKGNGKVFQFLEGDRILFIYKDEGKLYRFKNLKGGIKKINDSYVHVLYGIEDGESFNRRKTFRVPIEEEHNFSWAGKGREEILYKFKERMEFVDHKGVSKDCPCLIKNLSEQGVGICTNEGLQVSDFVSFQFDSRFGKVYCIGQVVRSDKEPLGKYSNFYGVEFKEVSNNIAKYVFEMQRLNLRVRKR